MKFVLVAMLVVVAQRCLIGTTARTDKRSESTLDQALRPLYSQIDTFRYQLDAVKALGSVHCNKASEWQLVFKGMAGKGVKLYGMWTAASWDDNTMGVSGSWRDESLHDSWKSGELSVRRVKLSLHDFEGRRVDLIFNGIGTDIHNWFTQERLISSPWQNLKSSTPDFFSTDGYIQEDRRFYINNIHNSCPGDRGWLVVIDSGITADCAWGRPSTAYPYPIILYSRLTGDVLWNNVISAGDVTVGHADFLTIHVDAE
ncbi:uncharacterized protein LOC119736108 [Patiria miniata]|uniref:Uncharacterized protein n=1 Tax=Patiria miniata TaxID=46514 RepID=A0A914AQX2_PATMI|nr:uncharacterized protein LOC119736108 [Patiria miniata]